MTSKILFNTILRFTHKSNRHYHVKQKLKHIHVICQRDCPISHITLLKQTRLFDKNLDFSFI